MKIAAIDIGTNTVLLLIAEVDSQGMIHFLHHEQRAPRLGKDVDATRRMGISAFDRIAWIVNEYKNFALQWKVDRIVSAATSAVRDAVNREEFLAYLKQTTGIETTALSGEEEARLTYLGAVSDLPKHKDYAILDIGGGSTELSFMGARGEGATKVLSRFSVQVGSVRLTERFLKSQPPTPEEMDNARQFIVSRLQELHTPSFDGYSLVGVAGTVTSLACFDLGLKDFVLEKVSGYVLPYERVAYWLKQLASKSVEEIQDLSNVTAGRADILTAGTLILETAMSRYHFPSVTVSERGLRYGMALEKWRADQGEFADKIH